MGKPITTTLKAIREGYIYGMYNSQINWMKLLKHLGKTEVDDEPLRFSTIAEAVGVWGAYQCLYSLAEEHKPSILRLQADIAATVLPNFEKVFPDDKRPREAIHAMRDYADGKITKEKLRVIQDAAIEAEKEAIEAAGPAWRMKGLSTTIWADITGVLKSAFAAGAAAVATPADAKWAASSAIVTDKAWETAQHTHLKLLTRHFG